MFLSFALVIGPSAVRARAEPPAPRDPAHKPADPAPYPPLSSYTESTLEGFRILTDPAFTASDAMRYRRLLAALTFDLQIVIERIPAPALEVLRKTPLVLTSITSPRGSWKGHGCCYHASAGWLVANGYDKEREGVVEILNADDYLVWRAEQPMMLLHELAHAYHARLNVDRADVAAAHHHALESKLYGQVPFALSAPGQTRAAYAATNPTEYFSELTEAYYGRNDFFPFTKDDLKTYDPDGYNLIERLWNLTAAQLTTETSPPSTASTP